MSLPPSGGRELPTSQYDISTYWGRVKHTATITDPRNLLIGKQDLEHAKELLSDYQTGRLRHMTPELWKAKVAVDSVIHPESGEPIFLPFRMSCFVLSGLVVTAGMLQPGLGTLGTVTWQVLNQSVNAGINIANATSSSISTRQLSVSYLAAVTVSCGTALGLNKLIPTLRRFSPATRTALGRLTPFAAVASAGFLNVLLMRGGELRSGIDVFRASPVGTEADVQRDSIEAEPLGRSRVAAARAVTETAASRVINSLPVMTIPPLALLTLQKGRWLQQRPRLVLPINLGLILGTGLVALPFALAVFPQQHVISVDRLEPELKNKAGDTGFVAFNRGM